MIVNRIKRNLFPRLSLLGRDIAGVMDEYTVFHDIGSVAEMENDELSCLVYDELPLLTEKSLEKLGKLCLGKNIGFRLGDGFIKKTGYVGELFSPGEEEFTVFAPENYSFFYKKLRDRIVETHVKNGVIVYDKETFFVDLDTKICFGAVIKPFVSMENTYIGQNTVVGEESIIKNSRIGDNCFVLCSSVFDSEIGDKVNIGPYAHIRMNSIIGDECRIGDYVEIKNSSLRAGVKAAHLSYIGDAEVGSNTNVGCGTVFCNFDGKKKHRTTVGSNVFIGANTNLIAPIKVGDDSFIAAGGTITNDVPENSFVIGRSRQTVKKQ